MNVTSLESAHTLTHSRTEHVGKSVVWPAVCILPDTVSNPFFIEQPTHHLSLCAWGRLKSNGALIAAGTCESFA